MLHGVTWLGQASCPQAQVFSANYMQSATPDPLPGLTSPTPPPAAPPAPGPTSPPATAPSRRRGWWVAPVLIGSAAGLIFWRTLTARGVL